jgi:hypothetical protein
VPTVLGVNKRFREEAKEHAKNRLGFEYDRFHLKTEQRLSMIALGTIGQIMFREYLNSKSIKFEFQLQFGKYDDYDFVIDEKIVEVKTSGFNKENEWKSLNGIYNASQLENALARNYFCSVQIFVNGYDKVNKLFNLQRCDTAIIAGWLEIKKISEFPTKYLPFGKARLFPLDNLKDISELIRNN